MLRTASSGITLVETIVSIGIIAFLTALLVVSWPQVRDRQAFSLAVEVLQTFFNRAREHALTESRTSACAQQYELEDLTRRQCAVVGVAMKGRELLLFADTYGTNQLFDEGENRDFVIERRTLPLSISSPSTAWQSWVFKAIPPVVTLYDPTGQLIGAGSTSRITLSLGSKTQTFVITPYGHLEPQ